VTLELILKLGGLASVLAFIIWIYRRGKQNAKLERMAESVRRGAEAEKAIYRVNTVNEHELDDELSEFTKR
jgi:hypothetical protein